MATGIKKIGDAPTTPNGTESRPPSPNVRTASTSRNLIAAFMASWPRLTTAARRRDRPR